MSYLDLIEDTTPEVHRSVARGGGAAARGLGALSAAAPGIAGTSFTARVSELRLQKAFAPLIAQDGAKRRISDIAMDGGFSDFTLQSAVLPALRRHAAGRPRRSRPTRLDQVERNML